MNKILIPLLLLFPFLSFAQSPADLFNAGRSISKTSNRDALEKRWFSNVEAEFGLSSEVRYDYSLYDDNGNLLSGGSRDLENKPSFGVLYSINYPVLNKLSLGAVTGFQYQVQQRISALKVGGIIRYHFVNYESVNINLMTAYNIGLSRNIKSDMANVRLGLQFPVARTDSFNLLLNVFWDFNDYILNEPVLGEPNERGSSILFRTYGISLGAQF